VSARHERRKQRSIVRKQVPSRIEAVEHFVRKNAAVFLEDGFEAPYIAASYLLIEHLVSKSIADQYFQIGGGKMTAAVGMALTTVGETIFELRSRSCLVEFCRRIATREPRASFHEALAARIFMENGFKVVAISETGVKGSDFDFSVRKWGQTVCVEVTTLTPPEFSPRTIQNALKAKVTQMRPDKPGVIVCFVPESWYSNAGATPEMARQARRLFGNSKRVNAVVYIGEQHNEVEVANEKYGMLQFRSIAVLNETARHPVPALEFLTTQKGDDQSTNPVLGEVKNETTLHRTFRDRPFFHWVDGLIGRTEIMG
jgi:hypothetical protein